MRSVCDVCRRRFCNDEGMFLRLNFSGNDFAFCSPVCLIKFCKGHF